MKVPKPGLGVTLDVEVEKKPTSFTCSAWARATTPWPCST
jgi:hypothetical protein